MISAYDAHGSVLARSADTDGSSRLAVARRVLHLINGELYAGAERVQDLLAARLPEFGYRVGFACVKPGQFAAMRMARMAPLHEIPMRSRLDISAVRSLIQLIRSAGYRLVHAHTPRTALLGRIAAHASGVPLVYHVHSPAARESTHRLRNRLNRLVEQWSLRPAARLIAVSQSLHAQLQATAISADRVRYVPNGVPAVRPFAARPKPSGTWMLGTVGLFRPRKGLDVLLRAMVELNRLAPGRVRLRAVGAFASRGYETRIKRLARQYGLGALIEWTGFTRDVSHELSRMDLLLLPSLFGEGMPMVVLEAMAAGVPVVATRVEGVPDAVRDGRDGLLVQPGNSTDLAQAVCRFVSGQVDWCHIRENARRRHAARFSDRSMAAGVAAVYGEVLGDP